MSNDIFFRLLANVVPVAGQFLTLMSSVQKRYYNTRALTRKLADPSWGFWLACVLPIWFIRLLLNTIFVAAVAMIVTGLLMAYAPANPFRRNSGVYELCEAFKWLFGHSYWIVVIYVVFAVAEHLDLARKIPLWIWKAFAFFRPSMKFEPGFINANELVWASDEHARLISVDTATCTKVANEIIGRLLSDPTPLMEDRALPTQGLTPAEQANVFLLGSVIEACVHALDQDHPIVKDMKFSYFFRRLGEVALTAERPLSPDALKAFLAAPGSLTDHLNGIAGEGLVPNEASVRSALNESARMLVDEYDADASKLANRRFIGPSAFTAVKRAKSFPNFSEHFSSMATQFVKLSVSAGLWPKVEPGPFVYPFSRTLTAYLFNRGCLVLQSDTKEIVFDGPLAKLSSHTMQLIVEAFDDLVKRDDPSRKGSVEKLLLLDNRPSTDRAWILPRQVDYFMWRLARMNVSEPAWVVDGNALRGA